MSKVFFYADFSQIELRCAAHVSQDPLMLQAYRTDKDLHLQTAKAIFNDPALTKKDEAKRQTAKTTNFLLIYNGSAQRLKDQLWEEAGIRVSFEEARSFRENFFRLYSNYYDYLQEQRQFLIGWKIVISPFGRIRRLPDLKYFEGLDYRTQEYSGKFAPELQELLQGIPEEERFTKDFQTGEKVPLTTFHLAKRRVGHAFNQGFNFPIQSMAASIMKRAMISLDAQGYDIVNNIHDSIYIQMDEKDIDRESGNIVHTLENIVKLSVPLKVEWKVKLHL